MVEPVYARSQAKSSLAINPVASFYAKEELGKYLKEKC